MNNVYLRPEPMSAAQNSAVTLVQLGQSTWVPTPKKTRRLCVLPAPTYEEWLWSGDAVGGLKAREVGVIWEFSDIFAFSFKQYSNDSIVSGRLTTPATQCRWAIWPFHSNHAFRWMSWTPSAGSPIVFNTRVSLRVYLTFSLPLSLPFLKRFTNFSVFFSLFNGLA